MYGFPNKPMLNIQDESFSPPLGQVFVPNSLRRVAETYYDENFTYKYDGCVF